MRNTKDRIAETALRLFNNVGTDGVSTNHIAAAMDISPGNLYYHFANKEAILLVLLERLGDRLEQNWTGSFDSDGATGLRAAVEGCFALLDQYRFFAREVFALAHRSAALRERTRSLSERSVGAIEQRISSVTGLGLWGHVPGEASRWLATALWLSILAYAASTELRADGADAVSSSDGVNSVLGLVEPYLRAEPRTSAELFAYVLHAS